MTDGRNEAVERWFIRRGVPNFIYDYRASTDVFTRAAPFLVLVFLFQVFTALDQDRTGWREVLPVLVAATILLAAAAAINRWRGRRLFQLPDQVGLAELMVFVFVPPIIPALFSGERLLDSIGLILINLLILGIVYVVVSFGLLPMTRWAFGHMLGQLGDVLNLMVRSLPLVLVLSTFLFLNAELWQVASDFTRASFRAVVLLLGGVAFLFLMIRISREVDGISEFRSWAAVRERSEGGPIDDAELARLDGPVDVPPLHRRERINVMLVLVFSQMVQVLLVSVIIGVFYFVFGVLVVREDTMLEWTELSAPEVQADIFRTLGPEGNELVLSWTLVRVSAFLAAFGGLQFTVTALTDESWRREFVADEIGDVRVSLAVRAAYLHGRSDKPAPTTD